MSEISNGPLFVGVGVSRAATTWTFDRICEHPDVADGYKAMNFFSSPEKTNLKGYLNFYSQFPQKYFGEWSNSYFASPLAVKRVKELFPKTRILVTLRNPVDRILSVYQSGKKEKPLPDFVTEVLGPARNLRLSGCYVRHLALWEENFKVKINLYEDLFETDTVPAITDFLGLRAFQGPKNEFTPKVYERDENYDRLLKFYMEPIGRLEEYLGRNLSNWYGK